VELFDLLASFHFNWVVLDQHFVTDRAPSVIFIAHIPPLVIFVLLFWLVEVNVDGRFFCLFFQSHVVTRCERIYVYYAAVTENLVVNDWREFVTSKSKSYMAT